MHAHPPSDAWIVFLVDLLSSTYKRLQHRRVFYMDQTFQIWPTRTHHDDASSRAVPVSDDRPISTPKGLPKLLQLRL
jgi:hypothetical protein